ncbi:MAG TPA: tRNA glutamyl-Q(34) synthetase GluQRS [Rhizomicrobium sp.]|jgi:glutamyl-Q tRNA(Asp) synthetase
MIVTRFAPSPTGLLHLGHAFAALTAHRAGGRFLLRIEDIDTARCREDFVTAIYEDLGWLGLTWERPVLRQSTRFAAYEEALALLGDLTYPCFCTRADIASAASAPHGPEGPLYPGTCRDPHRAPAPGEAYALRLDAAKRVGPLSFGEESKGRVAIDPLLFGDIVLARKDTPASYHLAVVVDDAHQGVTLVTRGEDLFLATHVQRLLQALLGLPAPRYAHHQLILGEGDRKFSKRDKAVTLRSLREAGASPGQIREWVGLP